MGLTLSDRTALARRLQQFGDPRWQQFLNYWISFNTLYEAVTGVTERDRAMNIVRQFIRPPEADQILTNLTDAIRFFSSLPPGNARYESYDPRFRNRSAHDMTVVTDSSADDIERLARLVAVVYQVRCNLVHGSKDPIRQRDLDVVAHSREVLGELLPVLMECMEKPQ